MAEEEDVREEEMGEDEWGEDDADEEDAAKAAIGDLFSFLKTAMGEAAK